MTQVISSMGPRKLHELLADLAPLASIPRAGESDVTGVWDDSRQVRAGGLFVAVRGTAADGRRYIADAAQRGAAAIVGEDLPAVPGVVTVNVPDARAALALLARRWHGIDGDRLGLTLLGVTGTNGKTTTAMMTCAILQAAGRTCGLLGTVRYELCGRTLAAGMTTPGALELAGYLRECRDAGADAAVMEVSSHALEQKRVDGLPFAAAAYTNLSGDHLDYHGTLERYRAAKARLFAGLAPDAIAVMNGDDANYAHLLADCRARVLTYAIDRPADVTGRIVSTTIHETVYELRMEGQVRTLRSAAVGRHNVYNALAAAGLAHAVGVAPDAIEAGLVSVRVIPGRLQRVPCRCPAEVFVDYAHTDDALRNVLSVLRPLTPRRLIVLFGAGGDRDRTKRPRMARAVAQYADAIVLTSDNPRSEDPRAIIDEVLTGFDASARRDVTVESDRALAIRAALAQSGPGDVVLLAGKGHEDYQILGARRIHFDDAEAAIRQAEELFGG